MSGHHCVTPTIATSRLGSFFVLVVYLKLNVSKRPVEGKVPSLCKFGRDKVYDQITKVVTILNCPRHNRL